ncbi:MAG: class I SAM-dependent methyltransferase [Rhodospirillales bacterium]|nr:class I SAM-dependent methyltransferase [Rhodospirillales bacterium]
MNGPCHRRTACRLCGGARLTAVLALAPTPPANAFIPEAQLQSEQAVFPLDVFFCEDCKHVQLLDVVDPAILFENYVYVSGTSPVFVRHFQDYAKTVCARFNVPPGGLVLDIGSNDGTLLAAFKEQGLSVLGVDPARAIAMVATRRGIETIAGFFTPELAAAILSEHGAAAVITANNVFAHADDLAGIVEGVRGLLAPGGVFAFEVSYLVDVYEKTLFDTIYHEHLAYHSVKPLRKFFAARGMDFFAAARVDSHGGSLRGYVQHAGGPWPADGSIDDLVAREENLGLDKAATLIGFGKKIEKIKTELNGLLSGLKAEGKSIAAYGAPAKATTLMYHFGLGPETIDFIVDDSLLKQGLYSPGHHIPVLPSTAIAERNPDYLLILAWNFAAPIMEKQTAFRDRGGRFIIPLPEIEVR